jgi:hypothetical protein
MMFDRRIAMVLIGSGLGIGLAMPVKAQQVVLTPAGSAFQAPSITNPFEGALPAPKLTPEEQKYVDWMNDPNNLPFPGPKYTPPEGKPIVRDPGSLWNDSNGSVFDLSDGQVYTKEAYLAKYGIQPAAPLPEGTYDVRVTSNSSIDPRMPLSTSISVPLSASSTSSIDPRMPLPTSTSISVPLPTSTPSASASRMPLSASTASEQSSSISIVSTPISNQRPTLVRLLPSQNVRFAEIGDSPLSSSRIIPMGIR